MPSNEGKNKVAGTTTSGAQKLFIGNCTKQVHDFVYRVPGEPRVRRQKIDVGTQILVGNAEGLPPSAVEMILKHHANFGLIDVAEIDRTKPFVGLCYSLDKPLTVDMIERGLDHNDAVLKARAVEQRELFALAANHMHEDVAGTGLKAITFDVEEVGKDATLNESTVVTRSEPTTPRRLGRRK